MFSQRLTHPPHGHHPLSALTGEVSNHTTLHRLLNSAVSMPASPWLTCSSPCQYPSSSHHSPHTQQHLAAYPVEIAPPLAETPHAVQIRPHREVCIPSNFSLVLILFFSFFKAFDVSGE